MNLPDERDRQIAGLRERLSRLSEASLRINESLDLDTVLQVVLDSARSLTRARYGVMTLHGDGGQVQEFLSSGMTSEEAGQLWDMPERWRLYEHLGSISRPLRTPDLFGYLRSADLPAFPPPLAAGPVVSFLASPVLHWGERVGNIYLADKEHGLEFAREDEETLVMFASQAALVIANARRHREERRARADLETLIDTSPVGVAVFDAATGEPNSFNREAGRIVDSLRDPDQTPEDLLNLLTFRRADGREVSLREFPVVEALGSGETLRAEEVVISVPDGRSVTVLLNATPILSDEGGVESMVVTIQDMAEVKELQRMRAEFLAMVSHGLRVPLAAIKGSASTVMDSSADLDPAVVRQFLRIIEDQADHMHALVADLLDVARIETGTLPVNPEPAEVAVLVDRARSGFANAGGKNNLVIDVDPSLPLVMADRRRIVQVLGNLLSNAARHSPGSSAIRVGAVRDGVHVAFSVADEGRGIPAERLPDLFGKFSRAQSEEQAGDTGLGLAICKGIVEAHGGRIWAESGGPGTGACFTFTLPSVEDSVASAVGRFPSISTRQAKEVERKVRILVVDDDPNHLRYVRDTLARSGYDPVVTGEPEEALPLVKEARPELVLLDLMLPGADGIELMKDVLDVADVPVILLSAYGREEHIARAFDTGADDYVVKPFSPTELSARIRAALRRREATEPTEPYVLGDLTIDYAGRRVILGGHPAHLTPVEYRVLAELSANAGTSLTYKLLLDRVWGQRDSGNVRSLRTIVNKLRRKLNDNANDPTYIFNEPRIGYRMPKGE